MFTCVLGRWVASTVLSAPKLQALVYDILPSTTAVFSYHIGSRKLSANEQFFVVVGAHTVVSLLQTTQIKQGVSFIAANRKLSANEQFFCWCSYSSKFVTNNSNKTRRVIYSRRQHK